MRLQVCEWGKERQRETEMERATHREGNREFNSSQLLQGNKDFWKIGPIGETHILCVFYQLYYILSCYFGPLGLSTFLNT